MVWQQLSSISVNPLIENSRVSDEDDKIDKVKTPHVFALERQRVTEYLHFFISAPLPFFPLALSK